MSLESVVYAIGPVMVLRSAIRTISSTDINLRENVSY